MFFKFNSKNLTSPMKSTYCSCQFSRHVFYYRTAVANSGMFYLTLYMEEKHSQH